MRKAHVFLLMGLLCFSCGISCAQDEGDEEFSYIGQSEYGDITVKMANDELEHTGVKIYFFDKQGSQIGKWEIADTSSDSWSLSPGGKYFQCQIFRRLNPGDPYTREVVVMNTAGKELFSYESSNDVGRWSPMDDYIVVHDRGFGAIRAYDLSGKVIWERKKPKEAKQLSLAHISKNGKYIALGEYPKTVVLLSKEGKELYRRSFEILSGRFNLKSILIGDADNEGDVLVHPGTTDEIRILDKHGDIKFQKRVTEYERFVVQFSTINPSELEIRNRKHEGEKTCVKWR